MQIKILENDFSVFSGHKINFCEGDSVSKGWGLCYWVKSNQSLSILDISCIDTEV